MNLNKKGWLKEYINIKEKELSESGTLGFDHKGQHPDQSLYAIIQPTGIMYGYPILTTDLIPGDIDQRSKVKLLLMNALLSSYVLIKESKGDRITIFTEVLDEGVHAIAAFYNSLYKELYTSPTSFFGKKKSDYDLLEKILDKRIESKHSNQNFWKNFFHNSLLFLDIYFFRQWVQTPDDNMITEYLKDQKDNIRLDIVKVMAAAAHANSNIEPEERVLFEHFIESLEFQPEKKKEAVDYFESGVEIEEIPLPSEDTWILKKFLFELAILTTWADQKIEESEENFLRELNSRLGFGDPDYEKSIIAVEGFVLEYWNELDKLKDKNDFEIVSNQYLERLSAVTSKYKDRLYKEIMMRGNLIKMIQKAKTGDVKENEKEFIREQLIKCLEEIPVFDVIALPQHFLSLPVIMKILPKDFFKEV